MCENQSDRVAAAQGVAIGSDRGVAVDNRKRHVMLDLETMGTQAGSAIVQIGAVAFGLDGIKETIEINVSLTSCVQSGLTMDAHTVLWWMEQDRNLCKQWQQNAVSLPDALKLFSWWLGASRVSVWGNAASFDNVLLRAAYEVSGITCPWPYWDDRCFRTAKALFNLPAVASERKHSALSDAISQARQIVNAPQCDIILQA